MLEALAAGNILATNGIVSLFLLIPCVVHATMAIEAVLLATNRRPGFFEIILDLNISLVLMKNIMKMRKRKIAGANY